MEINIIRGQNQIGGSIIEISSKNAKIILNEEVDDLLIADVINSAGHYKVKDVTEIS